VFYSQTARKDYVGGIEYIADNLEAIYHSEGRVTPNGSSTYLFEYTLKDHLGNSRVTFADLDNSGEVEQDEILQTQHYYPFGMVMEGNQAPQVNVENAYQYNGKELNSDFGLDWLDYGARWYDASIARWSAVDPLAEKFYQWSSYNYVFNNPIKFLDPDGKAPTTDYYNKRGDKIKTIKDGKKDKVLVLTKARKWRKRHINKKIANNDVFLLPSDNVLKETLDVLDRTIKNGGKSEETSIVMNDGTIIKGEKGKPVNYGKDSHAETKLPKLPKGKTQNDVEATIHSHPTKAEVVKDLVYNGDATDPTDADKRTLFGYKLNIIVSPLGKTIGRKEFDKIQGKEVTKTSVPSNGAVFYNNSMYPITRLSANAITKIISNEE